MSVLKFGEDDERIQRANNTDHGMASSVFTKDLARAHPVIAELEAGTCSINNCSVTQIRNAGTSSGVS